MFLRRLEVIDFRNYEAAELDLGPGPTTLLGPNGQGKTNLVEALGYVATLRSHRVATDAPLVRVGEQRAIVRAEVVRAQRPTLVELEINPGRANRARINRNPLPRARDVLGTVTRVLFAPEDLDLVKGDPSQRRQYLDDLLVGLAPRFEGIRSDLDRVLRQRNSLLRSAQQLRGRVSAAARSAAEETLGVWDQQLLDLSSELVRARLHLVARLADPLATNYAAVAGQAKPVACAYSSAVAGLCAELDRATIRAMLAEALERRRDEEFQRGVSLVGPHRDDLSLAIGGMPVRGYASHGESWSMALALRLASYDIGVGEDYEGGEPILVLDDVFAELDSGRRKRLAELVSRAPQVLVTAAVLQDVPEQLRADLVRVADGKVWRERAS